jgi:hypothetical protein
MLPFDQGCRLFQSLHFRKVVQDAQRRFCTDSNSEKSDPKFSSGRPIHAFGRPPVSRRFEQFKVASIQMSWQHIQTLIRVQQVIDFPSQTCIWEDSDGDQGTASKDLVQVPIGPVTRARAKKFKNVLNGLIQELWAQANSWRPIEHDPRGQQRIVTLIQVLEGSGQG